MSLHRIEKVQIYKNEKAYLNWFNYTILSEYVRFFMLTSRVIQYETFNPANPDFSEVGITMLLGGEGRVQIFEGCNAANI